MRILILLLALMASGPTKAEELTGGVLNSLCNGKEEVERIACRFYILGAVQGTGLGDGAVMDVSGTRVIGRKKTIFCMPDNMPISQMVDVFQKSMGVLVRVYPDDSKLPAIGLVIGAMNQAFPCPK